MSKLKVGSVVHLTTPMLGNKKDTLGVVYEEYNIGYGDGVSVIFPNGEYDGFSENEQGRFLKIVGFCEGLEGYKFTNVMQLSRDFQNGKFNEALTI